MTQCFFLWGLQSVLLGWFWRKCGIVNIYFQSQHKGVENCSSDLGCMFLLQHSLSVVPANNTAKSLLFLCFSILSLSLSLSLSILDRKKGADEVAPLPLISQSLPCRSEDSRRGSRLRAGRCSSTPSATRAPASSEPTLGRMGGWACITYSTRRHPRERLRRDTST